MNEKQQCLAVVAADLYAAHAEGRHKDGSPVAHELVDAFFDIQK